MKSVSSVEEHQSGRGWRWGRGWATAVCASHPMTSGTHTATFQLVGARCRAIVGVCVADGEGKGRSLWEGTPGVGYCAADGAQPTALLGPSWLGISNGLWLLRLAGSAVRLLGEGNEAAKASWAAAKARQRQRTAHVGSRVRLRLDLERRRLYAHKSLDHAPLSLPAPLTSERTMRRTVKLDGRDCGVLCEGDALPQPSDGVGLVWYASLGSGRRGQEVRIVPSEQQRPRSGARS